MLRDVGFVYWRPNVWGSRWPSSSLVCLVNYPGILDVFRMEKSKSSWFFHFLSFWIQNLLGFSGETILAPGWTAAQQWKSSSFLHLDKILPVSICALSSSSGLTELGIAIFLQKISTDLHNVICSPPQSIKQMASSFPHRSYFLAFNHVCCLMLANPLSGHFIWDLYGQGCGRSLLNVSGFWGVMSNRSYQWAGY